MPIFRKITKFEKGQQLSRVSLMVAMLTGVNEDDLFEEIDNPDKKSMFFGGNKIKIAKKTFEATLMIGEVDATGMKVSIDTSTSKTILSYLEKIYEKDDDMLLRSSIDELKQSINPNYFKSSHRDHLKINIK